MTPTEQIAVFLGWTRIEYDNRAHLWRSPDGKSFGLPPKVATLESIWPNFTDDRLKWYWIRRVEDALAEQGLLENYQWKLVGVADNELVGETVLRADLVMLRSTVEQRLQAALLALEESRPA